MNTPIETTTEVERFLSLTGICEHGLFWIGGVNKDGYGIFRRSGGRRVNGVYVHRYWYEYNNGAIPKGMHVHHACHLRRCLTHLELLTAEENARLVLRGAKARAFRIKSERRFYRGAIRTTLAVA